jgi:hypothetical protein
MPQSGLFGFRVAQARPDKVKALIAATLRWETFVHTL